MLKRINDLKIFFSIVFGLEIELILPIAIYFPKVKLTAFLFYFNNFTFTKHSLFFLFVCFDDNFFL